MGASLLALAKSIYIRFIAKRESRWSCDARVIQARFERDEIINLASRGTLK